MVWRGWQAAECLFDFPSGQDQTNPSSNMLPSNGVHASRVATVRPDQAPTTSGWIARRSSGDSPHSETLSRDAHALYRQQTDDHVRASDCSVGILF
jgi:hypothetical protein